VAGTVFFSGSFPPVFSGGGVGGVKAG